MSILRQPFGDEHRHRELMQRGKLDLMKPCPGCGCNISEHAKRCAACQAFLDRPRSVNDKDWNAAVDAGLIVPPKTEGKA